jgi:excisionase family DNA binding protein
MEAELTDEDVRRAQVPSDYLYFDVEEVAAMMRVAPTTVRTLLRKERWPHSKIGSQVRFALADLDLIREKIQVDVSPKIKVVPNVGTRAKRGVRPTPTIRRD